MKREAAAASDGDNAMGLGEGHSSSLYVKSVDERNARSPASVSEPCIDPGSTETRVTSLEATVAGLTNAVLALQATVATLEMQARSTNQALQFLLRDATLLPSHPFSSGILAQQPSNFNGSFTTSQRLSLGYQHGSPNSTLAPVSPAVSHAIGAAPAPFATPATQYAPFSFPATGGVDHGGWIARGEASGTTQDNLYPGLFAAPRHPASRPPSNTTTAHVFSSSSASYPVPIASSMPGSAPGDQEVHGARGESSSRDVDRFWSLHTHDC